MICLNISSSLRSCKGNPQELTLCIWASSSSKASASYRRLPIWCEILLECTRYSLTHQACHSVTHSMCIVRKLLWSWRHTLHTLTCVALVRLHAFSNILNIHSILSAIYKHASCVADKVVCQAPHGDVVKSHIAVLLGVATSDLLSLLT